MVGERRERSAVALGHWVGYVHVHVAGGVEAHRWERVDGPVAATLSTSGVGASMDMRFSRTCGTTTLNHRRSAHVRGAPPEAASPLASSFPSWPTRWSSTEPYGKFRIIAQIRSLTK